MNFYLKVKSPQGLLIRRFFSEEHRQMALKIFPGAKVISASQARCFIKGYAELHKKYPTFPFYAAP